MRDGLTGGGLPEVRWDSVRVEGDFHVRLLLWLGEQLRIALGAEGMRSHRFGKYDAILFQKTVNGGAVSAAQSQFLFVTQDNVVMAAQ